MHYCYILESLSKKGERYIGRTVDLRRRVAEHNAGKSPHTARFKPWKLRTYFAFDNPDTCARFESWLKSGSGYAFAKRHF